MTGFPRAALPLAIALLTLLAFAPVLQNGFVDWDDDINLVRNDHFRGLGGPQLRWMFSTTLTGHYIPFTWLSFGLDYQVWGMRPVGYHLTSLLLHALGATLLAVLTARLVRHATGWNARAVTTASTVAALVFALHPLRVESVAWATERRDVLSGVFILVTVLAYVNAVDAGT